MILFGAARQARQDNTQLGQGIWRRAHDRFRRGLDRYHQILEGVADDELHRQLVGIADELADLLPRVRQLCVTAQRAAPSDGTDIPAGDWAGTVHRALSRAGNALATTAEAVAMVRLDAGGSAGQPDGGNADATVRDVSSVRRRADAVVAEVAVAEEALRPSKQ